MGGSHRRVRLIRGRRKGNRARVLVVQSRLFAAGAVPWTWWWSSARSDFVAGAVNRDLWTPDSFSEIAGSLE